MCYHVGMTVKINDFNSVFILQDEIRRNEAARYDHRLHAVLLVAQGMTCPQVADFLGDSERAVRNWAQKFNDEGLPGLVETDKPGRPRKLSEKQLVEIGKVLRKSPMDFEMGTGIWDGKTLSAYINNKYNLEIGVRQCQRIFKHLGFRLRKPRPMIAHGNPEMQKEFKKNSVK